MSQPARQAEQPDTTARLRRLPAIDAQPPFDDELHHADADRPWAGDAQRRNTQGALALAFALPSGLPNVPALPPSWQPTATDLTPATDAAQADSENADAENGESPTGAPRLRLVPPPQSAGVRTRKPRRPSAGTLEEEFGPQPTPRAQLPEPQLWAARLVQAIVEVDAGLRPATQLIRWTTTAVHEAISRRPSTETQINGRRLGELVRSVRSSEPLDGVVEVSAVIQRSGQGGRCRAMALRLEGIDGRWQCTALETR
jgi:Family of unknown function (DUF6459)